MDVDVFGIGAPHANQDRANHASQDGANRGHEESLPGQLVAWYHVKRKLLKNQDERFRDLFRDDESRV